MRGKKGRAKERKALNVVEVVVAYEHEGVLSLAVGRRLNNVLSERNDSAAGVEDDALAARLDFDA
jgi:hypothetical protein